LVKDFGNQELMEQGRVLLLLIERSDVPEAAKTELSDIADIGR